MNKRVSIRHIVCIALAFALVVCASAIIPREVNASGDTPYIYVDRVICSGDDDFEINIYVMNNPGIVNMRLDLGYDKTALELVEIRDPALFPSSARKHSLDIENFGDRLYWNFGAVRNNNTSNGIVATLVFHAKAGRASGRHAITLSYSAPNSVLNVAGETVAFDIYNGYSEFADISQYTKLVPEYDASGKFLGCTYISLTDDSVIVYGAPDGGQSPQFIIVDSSFKPIVFE